MSHCYSLDPRVRDDLLAECYTIEPIQHRLLKALNDAIRLRAFSFGPRMIHIPDRRIKLVLLPTTSISEPYSAAIS
jgi:hypothetical protein